MTWAVVLAGSARAFYGPMILFWSVALALLIAWLTAVIVVGLIVWSIHQRSQGRAELHGSAVGVGAAGT